MKVKGPGREKESGDCLMRGCQGCGEEKRKGPEEKSRKRGKRQKEAREGKG